MRSCGCFDLGFWLLQRSQLDTVGRDHHRRGNCSGESRLKGCPGGLGLGARLRSLGSGADYPRCNRR